MPVSVLCGKTREKGEEQAKISENTKTTITTTKKQSKSIQIFIQNLHEIYPRFYE